MNILLTTSAPPTQTPFSTNEKRPPIGVGFLISVLRDAGHNVYFIDNYLKPNNFLETNYLQHHHIDFVGIYTNTICYRDSLRMFYRLEEMRQQGLWHGKIIAGGPHASVSPETIPPFVDHIVIGEGEYAIRDIVAGKVTERIVQYPSIENLDELPMPAWDYFAEMPYDWGGNWLPEAPVFTMNTSRGCPFDCTFCSVGSIWGRRYTYFSAERVVADIEYVVKHHGAKGIYFREDNFTLNKKRLYEFCNLMIERGINIPWVCETRASSLDRETVELMARAGAKGAYIGVESGSQRLLDFMHKAIKLEDVRQAFKLCQEFGINTAASIIVGVPTETQQDLQMTMDLLREIKPTVTWFNVFVGIPKSNLYRYVLDNKLYEYIDDRGLVYLKGHNERVRAWYGESWNASIPIQIHNGTIINPKISVVMSVYNGERYLSEAIKSIQHQSFNNFEFIIVNDASNDTTAEILNQIDDPRVRVFTNQQNLGLTRSLNKALKHCRGEYIARMDADDLSHPLRFEKQLSFLERHPTHALVGSSYYMINETGTTVSLVDVLTESTQIKTGLKDQNWFGHGSVMMRKSALDMAGGYDEEFRYAQDYDLWLRLSELYDVANIQEPLYLWRNTAHAISRSKAREQQHFAELAKKKAQLRALNRETQQTAPGYPLVSVIVPTYNRPDMLPDTLRSILAQTYPNIEIVVVNDAGQDVGHLVRSVAPNAVYIRHECNKGLAGARNTGIRHAKGKYIAYLDDDDIFYPEHIETLVTFLHNTGEKIAYSDAFRAHQARQADGTYSTANRDVPYSLDFDRSRILIWNFIPVLCVIHDIECINEAGYFDEQLRSHEDWDLWIRMSRKFTFHHIKKTTCEFTWRDDGSSMTSSKELEFISTQEVIYSKYRSISILSPEIIQNQNIELRNRKLKAGLLTSLPICSIVVPLYNAVNYTVQMLESLFRFTNSNLYELIIVDNASSDNTSKLLDSIDNQAIIIRNEKNEGFSRACNRGARYASTDFLIFLNSDTILTQNWLEPILNLAISDTNIAIVGNKHIFPDSGKLHHAGICFDENLINSHYLVGIDPADPRVNFQRDFQAVNGACMLVRKCFFDSIGGFNEIYLNGCEDVELCLEARRQGLRVVYTPKSTIMHYGQRSPGRNINDDRNMQIFMSRWKSRISADIKLLAEQESKHVAIKTVHLYPNVIAVLSTFNQPCGIATHTGYVIGGIKEALGDKGEEQRIIVLAEDTSERTGCDDETVFRCWRRGLNDYQEALNIVKRERVTVLHIQFQDGLFAGTDIAGFVRSCKALGVKVFITFHSSEHSLPLCAELVNLADRSFVHLDQSAIRLIAFGAQPNRVRKVTHGILENLNSELSLTKAKNLLDIPQELKIVSSFGFFDQYKGVVEIIQAFPHVLRHHNAAFIFLGGGHPTKPDSLEYIKKCRSVAESLGISDKIIFAKDFLPEKLVSDYLSASDAVVMNYAYIRNEISGAAAFALAHRRPLITSPVPAFRELTDCTLQLSQGLNLAEAIHLALSSPSLRKHLAERTTAYIAQNSYQKLGQTLCDEYGISRTDQQQVTIDVTHTTNECQSKSSTISASEKKKPHYNINWEGPQFMYHSLAHVNRELCKRLSERGHRLSLILTGDTDSFGPTDRQRFESLTERINTPLDAPVDVHVRHWYPPNLTPPAEGHWVMIQPWEMGSVPKRWIDVMSEQLDELWVPTSYVQECYIRSGLPAELVQVIPNGIDTTLFRPDAPSVTLPTSKKWKFLYVGSTTLDRKGFDILIDAYIREFSNLDDVTLVVKDMAVYTGGHNPVANQLRELAKKPGVPEILFIGQDLSGDQLAGIYTACDCLVHAYRGEGFGLPIAEAMSSGLPVIVTGHGAALDFCSNNNAYLIPACEVTLPTKQVYGMETVADPWWAKPDKDALRRLMRHVMSNPAEARMKGAKARRTIEERFTWDMAVTAVEERIALLCSRPVRRFAGKAPQQQDLVEQSSPAVGNLRAEAATPRHASVDGRNILVVAPILPTYDRDSGSFRLFQLLRLMRQEGHHVTFIARGEAGGADPQPYIRALTEIGIEVYPIDPEKLQRFFDINVDAPPVDLKKILTERFYDIAYLYFYHLAAQYLPELRGFSPQTRIVVDSVDFHYLRELRAAEVTGNTKALENAARVRELELGVYRLADLVIAVTNDDRRELLREAPELAVKVIPNIHPVATNVPDFAGRRDILFVGGFPHTPNIDAALYFCTEIWPEVSRRLPEANLYLVGNKPPESIQRLASRRVVVTGYVPDTKSYLEQCRVSIAPLRYGAGMKGKVGEALAAGLPVVATPVAAEGTGLENGRELLVASDAGSFIEAVVALYQNEALWTRLSANGLHFMAKNYSPDVVRLQLNDIIVQLTEIKNNVMKSTWLVDSSKVRDTLRSYGKSYQSLPIYRQI